MAMNGWWWRGLLWWMARATNSLPVPVSPWMRTVVSRGATRAAWSRTCKKFLECAYDSFEAVALIKSGAKGAHLLNEILPLHRAMDNQQQCLEIKRLGDVVIGSCLHRLDGGFDSSKCCDDDYSCLKTFLTDSLEKLEPRRRHPKIGDDKIWLELLQHSPSLATI